MGLTLTTHMILSRHENKEVFELIGRAIKWLNENKFNINILKWDTKLWGEIPADFGRK